MGADQARKLYEQFVSKMKEKYVPEKIQTGKFQEYMSVEIINDGPVTMQFEDNLENANTKNSKKGPQAKNPDSQ